MLEPNCILAKHSAPNGRGALITLSQTLYSEGTHIRAELAKHIEEISAHAKRRDLHRFGHKEFCGAWQYRWCRGPESNWLRPPFQGGALPVSYPGTLESVNFRGGRKLCQIPRRAADFGAVVTVRNKKRTVSAAS